MYGLQEKLAELENQLRLVLEKTGFFNFSTANKPKSSEYKFLEQIT